MHPLIGNLAIRPEGGVDWALIVACSSHVTIDDLYDAAEAELVGRSWRDAAHVNIERANARREAARERRRGRR